MNRKLQWILQNGAFAAALHLAVTGALPWLQYVITGLGWWTLFTSTRLADAQWPTRTITPVAVPAAAAMAFDLAVLASMFVAHWYWTAFAYAASRGLSALAQARAARP